MSDSVMRKYYAARAPEYDRVYLKPERANDLRVLENWLPSVLFGRSILEVACGTGYWTQFIAPVNDRVFAIDAAIEVLQIARTRVPAQHVQFIEGDAYCLPDLDPRPSGGFAGFWLSHVLRSEMRPFLQSFGRALRPGAKVVLLDNRFVEGSSTAIARLDSSGNTFQSRNLPDGSVREILKNFPTEEELRDTVAGFGDSIRYHEWQYFWALEYIAVGA